MTYHLRASSMKIVGIIFYTLMQISLLSFRGSPFQILQKLEVGIL